MRCNAALGTELLPATPAAAMDSAARFVLWACNTYIALENSQSTLEGSKNCVYPAGGDRLLRIVCIIAISVCVIAGLQVCEMPAVQIWR